MSRQPILDIKGLRTVFRTRAREIVTVNDVDIVVNPGETVALVGESGSGNR
ncbi:oligopeptide ABC transporter [Brucella suis]|nr:oligopeptide ABC transporter [Brucella suis]